MYCVRVKGGEESIKNEGFLIINNIFLLCLEVVHLLLKRERCKTIKNNNIF